VHGTDGERPGALALITLSTAPFALCTARPHAHDRGM